MSNRDRCRPAQPHPAGHQIACDSSRRERRGDDAESERHAEPAHRTGTECNQNERHKQAGQVGVQDGAVGAGEAAVERGYEGLACAALVADALVDQHVGVHRHAHREHDAGNAGQRQRCTEVGHCGYDHGQVDDQRGDGEQAEQAVAEHQEGGDTDEAGDDGALARFDRIAAERGTDRALLQDRQFRGQRAGAQLVGEQGRVLQGEARAADLAAAAEDRLVDDRRRDDLVVEHDRKRLAHVPVGESPELAGAGGVEGEVNDRPAGARTEGGLGVRQLVAAHHRRLFQHLLRLVLGIALIDFEARRNPGLLGFRWGERFMNFVERQLCRLPDQRLQIVGLVDARNLHENAAPAFAHDRGLGDAHRIHAPSHRFERRRQGVAHALMQADLRRRDADGATLAFLHLQIGTGRAHEHVAGLRDHLPQRLVGRVDLLRLGQAHLHGATGDARCAHADLGVAQALACIVAQPVEPILADVVLVHGEEHVGAPTQVETEAQLLLGQPERPSVHRLLREEARHAQQQAEHAYGRNDIRAPAGNVQHGRTLDLAPRLLGTLIAAWHHAVSLTGSPFTRTSATVLLITRTRVLSAISTSISPSSLTFVTLPMMPPAVTTASPRRIFATISRCAFARCC